MGKKVLKVMYSLSEDNVLRKILTRIINLFFSILKFTRRLITLTGIRQTLFLLPLICCLFLYTDPYCPLQVAMSALNLCLEVEEEELNQEFGGYKPRESASILTRCLNLDADLSVREAFLRLYAMLPERETQISYGDIRISWPELNLGGLLLDAARQIPYSHPAQAKLVKLVQNLGRCDRFTKPIGMPGYVFYDGMTEFKRECHRIGGGMSPGNGRQRSLKLTPNNSNLGH